MNLKEKQIIESTIHSILYSHMMNEEIEFLDINTLEVFGSRLTGTHRKDSDLDIRIEYFDDIKESDVFNMLNGLELEYDGIKVDFFPVKVNY